MITLSIRLVLQASTSFRAAPKAVHIAFSEFAAVKNERIPSHRSISRWLTQLGLYKLNCPKEQADDWACIIDNSVQIGTQKCLVILGVRMNELQRKALTFEDMEILLIEIHDKSNAEIVCNALEKAQKKVGKVAMVCADDGPDLRGGVMVFCKKHGAGRVFDIIHKIGTFLKKILTDDPEWQAFCSASAEAKKKMQQTKAAHLVPPNQRTKSRFLNIDILAHWAVDVMVALETNNADKELLENHCGWVREYKGLIERLKQFDFISQNTRQYIREHGICATTGDQVDEMLSTAMESLGFNMEGSEYAGRVIDFLHEQTRIVPFGQIWIGSSEIIESLFGKLKSLEQDQSKGGFTSLVLGVAACVGKIDADLVREALVQVKTEDVDKWTSEQIGNTLLSKRRKVLGGWRRKKKSENVVHKQAGILEGQAVGF